MLCMTSVHRYIEITAVLGSIISYVKEYSITFRGNSILSGLQFHQAREFTEIPMNEVKEI